MAIRYHSPSLSCLYKLVGDVFKLFDAVDWFSATLKKGVTLCTFSTPLPAALQESNSG